MIHSDESYSSITINHRLCDDGIKLILSIDARNGKVLLDSKGLKNIKGMLYKVFINTTCSFK